MATEPTPTDAELAAMRAEFGITSNGRGIKEFTQVRDFAHAVLARWGAQPAPAASPALGDGVSIRAYSVGELKVERARQLAGPDLWAVRDGSDYCLDKWGNWEWEPMPSSRDDKFLNRCRFATAEEAIAAAHGITKGA